MPDPSPSPHLLLIDDDEISRAVLELLLSEHGYTITPAEDGADALRFLRSPHASSLTAILSDLQMPGLSGPPLAQALRAALPAPIPLLAMSGSQPAPDRLLGFDRFLLKPFTAADLDAALHAPANTPAPAAPATPLAPILDATTFDQLMGFLRPAQQLEMLNLCFSELRKHLARMHAAVRAGDSHTLQLSAHATKGSFAMIGARELQHLAGELEVHTPTLPADQTASLAEIHRASCRLAGMLSTRGFQLATDLGDTPPGSPGDQRASPPDQETP